MGNFHMFYNSQYTLKFIASTNQLLIGLKIIEKRNERLGSASCSRARTLFVSPHALAYASNIEELVIL